MFVRWVGIGESHGSVYMGGEVDREGVMVVCLVVSTPDR